jgi:ABC-type spermidine/putrescine transport system permease subunit II
MSNVKTIDKLSLHLTTTLLVAGLVFPISPLLAASVKMLSSTGSSPCVEMRVEAGKEIVRAEDIIRKVAKSIAVAVLLRAISIFLKYHQKKARKVKRK